MYICVANEGQSRCVLIPAFLVLSHEDENPIEQDAVESLLLADVCEYYVVVSRLDTHIL